MKKKNKKPVAALAACLVAAGLLVGGALFDASAAEAGGEAFTAAFFTADNAELDVDDQGLLVGTSAEGGSVTFDRALPVQFIGVSFQALSEKANFSGVEFTLTDAENADKSVTLSFGKSVRNNEQTVVRINRDSERKVAVSLNGTSSQYFSFSYRSEEKAFVTYAGGDLGKIEKYADGDAFEGFPSGMATLSMKFTGVTGESGIRLLDIADQPLSKYVTADRQGPMMLLSRELPLMLVKEKGDTLVVPSAAVYDLFSEVKSVSVSVVYNGVAVYEGDAASEHEIALTEKGNCSVEYVAYDVLGNKTVKTCTVVTKDPTAPVITLKREKDTAWVGKAYTFQKADVVSENDAELYMYVVNENGGRIAVENNTYTFKKAGKYTVFYYAVDSYQNIAIETYAVEVKP